MFLAFRPSVCPPPSLCSDGPMGLIIYISVSIPYTTPYSLWAAFECDYDTVTRSANCGQQILWMTIFLRIFGTIAEMKMKIPDCQIPRDTVTSTGHQTILPCHAMTCRN